MKLRNKLLVALVPAALAATTMPIVLTSCGNSSSHVTYTGEKTHTSSDATWTLTFTLSSELETDQHLEVDFCQMSGAAEKTYSVSGKTVTVSITKTVPGTFTFGLIFKCFTGSSTVLTTWQQEIRDFTFVKE